MNTDFDIVLAKLRNDRTGPPTQTWRKVGRMNGISAGLACRMVKHGYEPKSAAIRSILGLRVYWAVPACPSCGGAHVLKRCPQKHGKQRDLFSLPVKELLRRLLMRETCK